jgi:hypothetical protein
VLTYRVIWLVSICSGFAVFVFYDTTNRSRFFFDLCFLISVIKGTTAYRGAAEGTQDVDTGTLLQMIGRAGRPGFDTSGTAVIMTDTLSKTRYENLSQG